MYQVGKQVVLCMERRHRVHKTGHIDIHFLPCQHTDYGFLRPSKVLADAIGDGLVSRSLSPVTAKYFLPE